MNKNQVNTNNKKTFTGVVVSNKMQQTITIQLENVTRHPRYKKVIRKYKKIYANDNLSAAVGDTVKVVETKPLSKLKRFETLEIIKKK